MQLLRFLRRTPCAVLLIAQLLGVLLYPFMEGSSTGRATFSVFGIVVLGLAVVAVRQTPFLNWVATLLAGPSVVLLAIQAVTDSDALLPWSSATEALLYFYTAGAMIAYMLEDHVVTTDELFAIGAVFTLMAWAFAYVYVVIQALEPGSFIAAINTEQDRTWMELLFLSFTTLSSTGLSDVVPVRPHARSISMVEQVTGLLYVAMIVSRLVGLKILRQQRRAP